EAGAKNGIFAVDEITLAYVGERVAREYKVYEADPNAEYDEVYSINLSEIESTVACPHLPENTKLAKELSEIVPDQVVIGSCTNGRISDMEAAAKYLKGKHVAKGIRCIIIPATQSIYKECIKRGYIETFIDAGCVVSTPTCGPCLGGYMGILAEDEIAVATTNRNFVGRMGHITSKIYLASPEVAAATAVAGHIVDPSEV
ncbi:MAG: 3-isopropylmalate dehydratase large subunit, partial [Clostridia bacterium]|nr:3-isopropylmalate dehydratase large subunit [Clostridia bacterium]